MKRWMLVVAVVSAVACNSKKSDPAPTKESGTATQSPAGSPAPSEKAGSMKTFTVNVVGGAGPVKAEAAIPSGWTTDASDPDMPTFKVNNLDGSQLSITANSLGRDPAQRLSKAINMQFGSIQDAKREDLPDGRVWMVGTLGENTVARLYVPFEGGVVMGGATIPKGSEDRLPEIRKAFETITVVK